MKRTWLRCVWSIATVLVLLTPGLLRTQAHQAQAVFACHGIKKPNCRGVFSALGVDLAYEMSGRTSFADVDVFTDSKTPRKLTWRSIAMAGTIGKETPMEAVLDPARTSTGTVLSVGRKEFPATATMQFYFRIETQGMVLVSGEPAVFEGTIHSIPPAAGDALKLVSGPVSFHLEGKPGRTFGTLKEATVSFGK